MGDSYHVVGSERDIFAVWGHLAGSGMLLLPAITAGPRRGSGPIRAPDSGDDTEFRGGPPPRTVGPIKLRADPPLSLCPVSPPAQAGRRLRLLLSLLDSSSLSALSLLPLKLVFDSTYCRHHLDSAFCLHCWTPPPLLHPHEADSSHPPGPAYHSVHSLWTPPFQLNPLLHVTVLTRAARSKRRRASCHGSTAPWSIPLKRIGGAFGYRVSVIQRS